MDKEQLKKLAHLARIKVDETKLDALKGDLESILGYVKQLEDVVVTGDVLPKHAVNILREDEETHASGIFTEDALANAPLVEDGFIKVPKIL